MRLLLYLNIYVSSKFCASLDMRELIHGLGVEVCTKNTHIPGNVGVYRHIKIDSSSQDYSESL